MEAADTLLSWLHNNVAETLAETRRRTPGEEAASTRESVLTYSTSAQLAWELPKTTTVEHIDQFDKSEAEVRWLPPGTTLAEMRDLAQTFLPEIKTSYSTFCICYQFPFDKRGSTSLLLTKEERNPPAAMPKDKKNCKGLPAGTGTVSNTRRQQFKDKGS